MAWLHGPPKQGKHKTRSQQRSGIASDLNSDPVRGKVSMKELFGTFKKKSDGSDGKMRIMPEIHTLHKREEARYSWIDYAALDARATWQLHTALKHALTSVDWVIEKGLQLNLSVPKPAQQPSLPEPATPSSETATTFDLPTVHILSNPVPSPVINPPPSIIKPSASNRNKGSMGQLQHHHLSTVSTAAATTPAPALTSLAPVPSAPVTNISAPEVDIATSKMEKPNLYDFYQKYWVSYGVILTDMEDEGMLINRGHLAKQQIRATEDIEKARQDFLDWAETKVKGASNMNPGSGAQIRALLFPEHQGVTTEAEKAAKKEGGKLEVTEAKSRAFRMPNENFKQEMDYFRSFKKEDRPPGLKLPRAATDMVLHGIWGKGVRGRLEPEKSTANDSASVGILQLRGLAGKPGKAREALVQLKAEQAEREGKIREAEVNYIDIIQDSALPHIEDNDAEDDSRQPGHDGEDSDSEQPSHDGELTSEEISLEEQREKNDQLMLEAKTRGFGTLYAACGGGVPGLEACQAIESLCEVNAIGKLISSFLKPLQGDDIATSSVNKDTNEIEHRVHCSLNINTETGRLSARRPNLQNQPSLEKDRYKVRKAFTAGPGNTLVVADYGQLELRILAHMANCKSMLDAFKAGGDFHSRTAYGMYDHIKKAVRDGTCVIEREPGGNPNVPALKDRYASERRMAKVLNFSIAYGKTAHGLSKDFGTTIKEAEATVKRWYDDRKEVQEWQLETIKEAKRTGHVTTLLGRTRKLADINSRDWKAQKHHERAAINTPIQGSAADVVAAAMVAIARCDKIEAFGFTLLMQIHDEVILEGPTKHAAKVRKLVMQHMANPWAYEDFGMSPTVKQPLLVELLTDCKIADTWIDAK